MFDFDWNGIRYTMPLSTAQKLASYFREAGEKNTDVKNWFAALPETEKQSVHITPL
jgi:hypothetical protein